MKAESIWPDAFVQGAFQGFSMAIEDTLKKIAMPPSHSAFLDNLKALCLEPSFDGWEEERIDVLTKECDFFIEHCCPAKTVVEMKEKLIQLKDLYKGTPIHV